MSDATLAWAIGWRSKRGRLMLLPFTTRRTRRDCWLDFAKGWRAPEGMTVNGYLKARGYRVYKVRLELVDG